MAFQFAFSLTSRFITSLPQDMENASPHHTALRDCTHDQNNYQREIDINICKAYACYS